MRLSIFFIYKFFNMEIMKKFIKTTRGIVKDIFNNRKRRKFIRKLMKFVIFSLLYASIDVGTIEKIDYIMRWTKYF